MINITDFKRFQKTILQDFVMTRITPKYFFRSNKYLHLFETHCAPLPLFNPNLDFLVLSLCKHACKSVCDVHPGINPYTPYLLGRATDNGQTS